MFANDSDHLQQNNSKFDSRVDLVWEAVGWVMFYINSISLGILSLYCCYYIRKCLWGEDNNNNDDQESTTSTETPTSSPPSYELTMRLYGQPAPNNV